MATGNYFLNIYSYCSLLGDHIDTCCIYILVLLNSEINNNFEKRFLNISNTYNPKEENV
jgi:hypothetical protein